MPLFDGDMSWLSNLFGGSAAGGQLTPEQLLQSNAAQNPVVPPPEPFGSPGVPRSVGTQLIEPNPSPVAAGTVPLPRPAPPELSATSEQSEGATRLGLAGPEGNPVANIPGLNPKDPSQNVGAAFAAPLARASDPTGIAARAPSAGAEGPTAPLTPDEEKRPSLAQALRGAQMPAAPVQQKIASPNAPRPTGTIKSGELQALLMALNAGAPNMQRPLPTTLGRG
jgi:hypothetical protein